MSTATLPDVDVLEALDWHHETPCAVTKCPHDRPPVRWRVVWWCGCVSLSCDPCKLDLDRVIAQDRADRPRWVECDRCGEFRTVVDLRELVRAFEPLA